MFGTKKKNKKQKKTHQSGNIQEKIKPMNDIIIAIN